MASDNQVVLTMFPAWLKVHVGMSVMSQRAFSLRTTHETNFTLMHCSVCYLTCLCNLPSCAKHTAVSHLDLVEQVLEQCVARSEQGL